MKNNLNDFVNTLDTYDIRVKLTKDKDFLYQHPENKNWLVSGKKLGYDYTRTNLIILFQKQNSNKIKKHSPDNKTYNDLTNKVREIGYTISKQHIGYIDPKTKLTLGDVAKAMRICSYYSVWSIREIDNKINLAKDKVKEKLFFAKNIINKLENLDDVRKEFEKENPPAERGKYDVKNISKSQSLKIQKDYLSKRLEKLKSVTIEEEHKTIVKQRHNQPLDSSTKHQYKERRR